jgi:acyl-CoA oxidase
MVRSSLRYHFLHLFDHQRVGLTRTDLLTLSRKFWELHSDPIMVMDAAAATLCTIQYNLSAGTLIRYATRRTDFDQIIEKILRFEVM